MKNQNEQNQETSSREIGRTADETATQPTSQVIRGCNKRRPALQPCLPLFSTLGS